MMTEEQMSAALESLRAPKRPSPPPYTLRTLEEHGGKGEPYHELIEVSVEGEMIGTLWYHEHDVSEGQWWWETESSTFALEEDAVLALLEDGLP